MDPMDRLLSQVLILFLMFVLFLIPLALIILANLGEKFQSARMVTIAIGLVVCFLALACGPLTALSAFTGGSTPGLGAGMGLTPLMGVFIGLVLMGTGFISALPYIPQVRRVLAYLIPIRPESIVNAVALSLVLLIMGVSVAQLPLAFALANPSGDQQAYMELANTLPLFWLQAFMFVLYGFFGVGWVIRRGWRDTLQRLGLGRLTPAGLSIAIAAWLGLFLMDIFVSLIWRAVAPGAYEEFGNLSKSLFGSFISIPGALTIGLSAGIGEEILFRGALQPRLGILLTAILFMIVHAQYGFTPALIQIFVVGIVLGLIRRYTNTTTCIVVHALFNSVSVLIALFFPNWM